MKQMWGKSFIRFKFFCLFFVFCKLKRCAKTKNEKCLSSSVFSFLSMYPLSILRMEGFYDLQSNLAFGSLVLLGLGTLLERWCQKLLVSAQHNNTVFLFRLKSIHLWIDFHALFSRALVLVHFLSCVKCAAVTAPLSIPQCYSPDFMHEYIYN